MNIDEAKATQTLLGWLLDRHAPPVAETAAREAAGLLADRANATLGAGMQYLDVIEGWLFLLEGCGGCPNCSCPDQADHAAQPVEAGEGAR